MPSHRCPPSRTTGKQSPPAVAAVKVTAHGNSPRASAQAFSSAGKRFAQLLAPRRGITRECMLITNLSAGEDARRECARARHAGGRTMSLYLVYELPGWLLCLLMVIFCVGAALLGLFVTRAPARRLFEPSPAHNDIVSYY